ncbi:hypothetical protein [Pseudonocardia sp. DLS-67]
MSTTITTAHSAASSAAALPAPLQPDVVALLVVFGVDGHAPTLRPPVRCPVGYRLLAWPRQVDHFKITPAVLIDNPPDRFEEMT